MPTRRTFISQKNWAFYYFDIYWPCDTKLGLYNGAIRYIQLLGLMLLFYIINFRFIRALKSSVRAVITFELQVACLGYSQLQGRNITAPLSAQFNKSTDKYKCTGRSSLHCTPVRTGSHSWSIIKSLASSTVTHVNNARVANGKNIHISWQNR